MLMKRFRDNQKRLYSQIEYCIKRSKRIFLLVNLLKDSEFIDQASFDAMAQKCDEIIKILSSIILTTKEKYFTNKSTHNS